MTKPRAKFADHFGPALVAALAGFVLFHFFGNATHGYLKTTSLFLWWGYQWFDPASETEHGPLILIVSLVLFARNLRAAEADRDVAPWTAVIFIVGSMGLHVVGYAAQQTRVSLVALLIFIEGLFLLIGGWRWARAAIFPLGFLLLAIPVNFLDSLGYYLRLGVVQSVAPLVHAMGVEVIRSGTQLFAPDGRYQYDVAAACSGVRSLIALIALALLVGYLEFRRLSARVLLVLLSVPFIFAGNVLRIAVIVLAGEWGGRASGEQLHRWSGYLVFVVVLGLLFAAVRLMKRLWGVTSSLEPSEGADESPSPGGVDAGSALRSRGPAIAAICVILSATGAAAWATRRLDSLPLRSSTGVRLSVGEIDPVDLPAFLGTEWIGQRTEVTSAEREILPTDTGYSRRNYVSIADRARQVFFSIVLSGRDRSSIHRPELCLGGQGWTIQQRFMHTFSSGDATQLSATVLRIEREVLDGPSRRHSVPSLLAYWFINGEENVPTHGEMLWRSAVDRLTRFRADRWAYVVMQTPLGEGGEAESLARMQEVLTAVWPQVRINKQAMGVKAATTQTADFATPAPGR